MRQYAVLVKEYSFNELSESAKDKAIEKLYDLNLYDGWWESDGMLDMTTEELKSRHIDIEVEKKREWWGKCLFSYTGIYFDLDRNHHLQFENLSVNDDNIFRKFLRIPKPLWYKLDGCWEFENNGRYPNTELVFDTYYAEGNITDREQAILDRASEIFSDKVSEALLMLQKEYDYQSSREAIIEGIEANEYSFDLDGNIV